MNKKSQNPKNRIPKKHFHARLSFEFVNEAVNLYFLKQENNFSMGRSFELELSFIPATVKQAGSIDLEDLERHISETLSGQVMLVGAGGSLTAAEFAHALFEERGVFASSMTPLTFIENKTCLRNISVVIFTAGGNNKDILATFNAARNREAKKIIVICGSKRSKIAPLASKCDKAYVYSFNLSTGRDGYLATNSLIATCIILSRLFQKHYILPENVERWIKIGRDGYTQVIKKRHYLILFSSWVKIAAVDMESKLSESGIAGSMLVDYRHFAHGRHNWIDKQGDNTGIIAFATKEADRLAKSTLNFLPNSVPQWKCETVDAGAEGALKLLLATFGFISSAGKDAAIDPGRPGVPNYGSKLYSLGPVRLASNKLNKQTVIFDAAVERKWQAIKAPPILKKVVLTSAEDFCRRISDTSFGGLVTDFDGTVISLNRRSSTIPDKTAQLLVNLIENGIPIIFATGRGDSLNETLKLAFEKKLWPLVNIGYYNGSVILPLTKSEDFVNLKPAQDLLTSVADFLNNHLLFKERIIVKNKIWQISVSTKSGDNINNVFTCLNEYLVNKFDRIFKVVMSSHSIDIIPKEVSKSNCINFAKTLTGKWRNILSIGDCGAQPGNDYELLQTPYSLSVDKVSPSLDSCWNFLPPGVSHSEGFEYYLTQIKAGDNRFSIRLTK